MLRVLNFLVFLLLFWGCGFLWFLVQISEENQPLSRDLHSDAIVVLTGGSNRIRTGITLLEKNAANHLFISGVNDKVTLKDLAHLIKIDFDSLPKGIELGYDSDSTIENAQESKEWIEKNNVTSILLVTANYHIPRSLLEFKKAMPHLKITTYPVTPSNFDVADWWKDEKTGLLILYEYHKYLSSLLRYLLDKRKSI